MKGFPTGCVNGPAGGLNACTRLLTQLRTDTDGGCHRSPHHHHANPAASVLSHSASLTIELITGPLRVDPHMARSMPANRNLYIGDGGFLKPVTKPRSWPDVITVFLKSLAKRRDGKPASVIVSGTTGTGTPRSAASRTLAASISHNNPVQQFNPTCPKPRNPALASTLLDRQKILPKNIAIARVEHSLQS